MPRGQKAITWTYENQAKYFQAIVAIHDIKIDYAKVAEAMDVNVPASALISQMAKMRQKAVGMGLKPAPATANHRTNATTTNAEAQASKAAAKVQVEVDSSEDDLAVITNDKDIQALASTNLSDNTGLGIATQTGKDKVIGGRVGKARLIPRKTNTLKYKQKFDPPNNMATDFQDEEGKNTFQRERTESEKSWVSDDTVDHSTDEVVALEDEV